MQVAGPQNAYNLAGEWSLSTQNAPNRFTMAATYELPFGKGKKYLTGGRFLNYVVGGWSLNTFGIIQSGFPLAVTQANANGLIGASYQRPNATGVSAGDLRFDRQSPQRLVEPGGIQRCARAYIWQYEPIPQCEWPQPVQLWISRSSRASPSASGSKPSSGRKRSTRRILPISAIPNTTLTNNHFGVITAQINNPRLLQLGLGSPSEHLCGRHFNISLPVSGRARHRAPRDRASSEPRIHSVLQRRSTIGRTI